LGKGRKQYQRGTSTNRHKRFVATHQKEALEKTLVGRAYLEILSIFQLSLIANPTGRV
jgi:hypothetical protein